MIRQNNAGWISPDVNLPLPSDTRVTFYGVWIDSEQEVADVAEPLNLHASIIDPETHIHGGGDIDIVVGIPIFDARATILHS